MGVVGLVGVALADGAGVGAVVVVGAGVGAGVPVGEQLSLTGLERPLLPR